MAQSKTTKDAPKGKQVARKATPDQPRDEEPEDLASSSSSSSSSSASETIGASVRKKTAPQKRKASPLEGELPAARKSSPPNTAIAAAEAKTADTRTPVTAVGSSSAPEAMGSSADGSGNAIKTVSRDGGDRETAQAKMDSTNSGKDAAIAPSGVVSGGGTRGATTSSAAPDTSKKQEPTLKRRRRSEPSDKTGTAKTSKGSDVTGGSASAKGVRGDCGSKTKVAKFPGYLESDDVSEKVLFGLPRGEKCPIDVLWEVEVHKSGRKTEQVPATWYREKIVRLMRIATYAVPMLRSKFPNVNPSIWFV